MLTQLMVFFPTIILTFSAEKSVMWLKQVVHTHASQLMALGTQTLFAQFGPLLGIIEHRTSSLQQLSK